MKIVIVTDKENTAIDRIAQMIQRLNHLDIVICRIHPKRPSPDQLAYFDMEIKDADILDVEYWKSGEVILDRVPQGIKKILAHHNPYDVGKDDWFKKYDVVIAKNKEIHDALPGSRHIHIPVDLDFFTPGEYDTKSRTVLMVANRIESKKGILEVAQAVKELGYHMVLVGAISDQQYFEEVMKYDVEFFEQISNEELRALYWDSAIHVCNSADNFESGTMPILEAMACGIPVLTRPIGHVPEIWNRKNMVVRFGAKEDVSEIKQNIKTMMEDDKLRLSLRSNGFKSVRAFSHRRMMWFYESLYWETIYPDKELVSVIIPTHNRADNLKTIVDSIEQNDYPAKEVVIVDDRSSDNTYDVVLSLRSTSKLPIKYFKIETEGYNLALARNKGAREAAGKIFVFLDDRYALEPDAISNLIGPLDNTKFTYGIKDGVMKGFVENFAAIKASTFFDKGMFTVGMPYGFLSQETRARFTRSGIDLIRVESAKAKSISKSRGRHKYQEIAFSKDYLYKMGYGKY